MLALDALQPVGRLVLLSKFAQMICPLLQPLPAEDELDELELELELEELELLELDELFDELALELLELDELLDDELLELDELVDPLPPQAARAQDARISGINLRMNFHSLSYCYLIRQS